MNETQQACLRLLDTFDAVEARWKQMDSVPTDQALAMIDNARKLAGVIAGAVNGFQDIAALARTIS